MGKPMTRDRNLFRQFCGPQRTPSKERASILDGVPYRAERRLLDEILDLSRQDLELRRPVLLEREASRAMPSSQRSSPCGACKRRTERLQVIIAECVRLSASDRESVRDTARRAPVRSTRRDHMGSRAMANANVVAQEQANQRPVLA
jgi:hypothetical protein